MTLDLELLDAAEKLRYALRGLYLSRGYRRYRMGKFEEYDLYGRFKEFLTDERVLTFTDTDGKLLALKPDVTLSIAKNTPDDPAVLTRLCYDETVYRAGRIGGFREIMQSGLECMGPVTDASVGEVLELAGESLSRIRREFVLAVSHQGLLEAFVRYASSRPEIQKSLLTLAAEKNVQGLAALGAARALPEDRLRPLSELLRLYGPPARVLDRLEALSAQVGALEEYAGLRQALEAVMHSPLGDRVRLDPSVVGNGNYYGGVLFHGFVKGAPDRVLSGGQYDRLMDRMGKRSGAVGFAVYLNALEDLKPWEGTIC